MSQPEDQRTTISIDIRMVVAMLGILVAPFVGLLYSAEIALGVLTICLALVAWFSWQLSQQVSGQQRRPLVIGTVTNAVMAVAALVLLLTRL